MKKSYSKVLALIIGVMLIVGLMTVNAGAENAAPAADSSPAIYVAEKTASSVVGVITSVEGWDRSTGKTVTEAVSQGSGVVIAEGGYIVTNNHVIENGTAYQVLMPSGEKVDAELVGADSSTDLAVLKVSGDYASQLKPVDIGSTGSLPVGSTVIAIGNPGGEVLSNTVTQGIVSALERSNVKASNTSRAINYIQHDAAINSGNSGGGLFNYKGELVGINTLKYSGSAYSSVSFEGLGFAIPIETVKYVTDDLIQYGKVQRAGLGITGYNYTDGPDEPMTNYAPAGVYVAQVLEGEPAEAAGMQVYDYIYAINGVRVTSMTELTTELDKYSEGDTVQVEVVRYANISLTSGQGANDYYSYFFGNGSSAAKTMVVSGGYEKVTLDVTLKILDD